MSAGRAAGPAAARHEREGRCRGASAAGVGGGACGRPRSERSPSPLFHVKHSGRLDDFVATLRDWQSRMNLIAPSTEPHLWTRHVADSLQLLALAPPQARTWVDLGSGGGFPGLVIACALADTPGAQVHLVESK